MSKLLLLLSFISIVILAIGTAFMPGNELFLLAGRSSGLEYVREILATILFSQLITHPPRHIFFRLLAGGSAIVVAGWTILSSLNGNMLFLDTLSMLAAAIAIGVTALEVSTARAKGIQRKLGSNPLIA